MRWNYTCYLLNWTDWSCLYSPVHSLSELNLNQICTQSKPIKSPLSLHSRGLLLFGFYDLTDQGLVFLFIQSTTIELLVTYIHIRPFKPFSGTFQAKLSRVQVIIKYGVLTVVYEGEWGPGHHSSVTAGSGHSLLSSLLTWLTLSSLRVMCHGPFTLLQCRALMSLRRNWQSQVFINIFSSYHINTSMRQLGISLPS